MKKTKPKKKQQEFGDWWTCQACAESLSMSQPEMMAHLRDVHGIQTEGLKANRSMMMHVDGDDWFSSTYEWTIGELKVSQYTCKERKPAWR